MGADVALYIAKDMQAGDEFTPENLCIVRPGFGLPPKYYEILLGRRITKDATKGTPVNWELV
jgi:N-acetylneuraminate synthase